MARRTATHYKKNPFSIPSEVPRGAILWRDDYFMNLIVSLSPMALRVLTVMLAKIESDGTVRTPFRDLIKITNKKDWAVNKGINELIQFNIIQKKTFGEYYINPKVAKPIHL